jgi:pentatricopeptide repeat protein
MANDTKLCSLGHWEGLWDWLEYVDVFVCVTENKRNTVLFIGQKDQFQIRKTTTMVTRIECNEGNSSVKVLCKQGRLKEAMRVLRIMCDL